MTPSARGVRLSQRLRRALSLVCVATRRRLPSPPLSHPTSAFRRAARTKSPRSARGEISPGYWRMPRPTTREPRNARRRLPSLPTRRPSRFGVQPSEGLFVYGASHDVSRSGGIRRRDSTAWRTPAGKFAPCGPAFLGVVRTHARDSYGAESLQTFLLWPTRRAIRLATLAVRLSGVGTPENFRERPRRASTRRNESLASPAFGWKTDSSHTPRAYDSQHDQVGCSSCG